jgi:hypothetical protein
MRGVDTVLVGLGRHSGAGRMPAVVFRFDRALGGMVRLTPAAYRRAIVVLFGGICRRVCRRVGNRSAGRLVRTGGRLGRVVRIDGSGSTGLIGCVPGCRDGWGV